MPATIEKKKSNRPKIIPGDAEFKSTLLDGTWKFPEAQPRQYHKHYTKQTNQ